MLFFISTRVEKKKEMLTYKYEIFIKFLNIV